MSHPKIACRPNFWFLVVTLLMPACADTVYYASLNNPPQLGCDALLVNWIDLRSGKHQTPSVEGSCIVYNDVSTVPNDGLKTPAVSTVRPSINAS